METLNINIENVNFARTKFDTKMLILISQTMVLGKCNKITKYLKSSMQNSYISVFPKFMFNRVSYVCSMELYWP